VKGRQANSGLSLTFTGKALLVIVAIYTLTAAAFSMRFLERMESDAQFTQLTQIPLVLSQNRNAVKIERLSSLIRSIYLVDDKRLERQLMLQTQALTQSFSLDRDIELSQGALAIARDVKKIVRLRQKLRDLEALQNDRFAYQGDAPKIRADVENDARKAFERATSFSEQLGLSLGNDAAALAHRMARDVESAARVTQRSWLIILTIPLLSIVLLLVLVKRHIVGPVKSAADALEAISRGQVVAMQSKVPVFQELRMIAHAIKSYGNAVHDLRHANEVLVALSDEDPLTKLANRRSFDKYLSEQFALAEAEDRDIAVLMVDLDHFKSVNDQYGHLVGDTCLRMTGELLKTVGRTFECQAARYGGEEFIIVIPSCGSTEALRHAETIRTAIMELAVPVTSEKIIRVTASIGVANRTAVNAARPQDLIDSADNALYLAKHSGRNVVKTMAAPAVARSASHA
jgi:diguanylate cyclase (GGDEF)-like protein